MKAKLQMKLLKKMMELNPHITVGMAARRLHVFECAIKRLNTQGV